MAAVVRFLVGPGRARPDAESVRPLGWIWMAVVTEAAAFRVKES
jgi:hypothetical protein